MSSERRFSLQLSSLLLSRRKSDLVKSENRCKQLLDNDRRNTDLNLSARCITFASNSKSSSRISSVMLLWDYNFDTREDFYGENVQNLKIRTYLCLVNKSHNESTLDETFAFDDQNDAIPVIATANFLKSKNFFGSSSSINSWNANYLGAEIKDEKLRLMKKIENVKEKMKAVYKNQSTDVENFLIVSANIGEEQQVSEHNPQMVRIRQVFEKKNRQSSQLIINLQRKMESYQEKLSCMNDNQDNHVQSPISRPRTSTMPNNRTNQFNKKDEKFAASEGLTLTPLSAVPKNFVTKFLKKSESAGNIIASSKMEENLQHITFFKKPPKSTGHFHIQRDKVACNVVKHNFTGNAVADGMFKNSISNPSLLDSITQTFDKLFEELETCRLDVQKTQLRISELTNQVQEQYGDFQEALDEHKLHLERLENQFTGQTDLHKAEVSNLKNETQNLEDRLKYKINESFRDVTDESEKLQTEVDGLDAKLKSAQCYIGMESSEGFSTFSQRFKQSSIIIVQIIADLVLWIISLLNE